MRTHNTVTFETPILLPMRECHSSFCPIEHQGNLQVSDASQLHNQNDHPQKNTHKGVYKQQNTFTSFKFQLQK